MPLPIDPRRMPVEVQIHVTSGAGVDITWSDGHASHYPFDYLRNACPCATCGEKRRREAEMAQKRAAGASGAALPATLPIFKPTPRARAARAVGQYALQIDFTDGHSTGIYSFDYLREICPCDACRAAFSLSESAG